MRRSLRLKALTIRSFAAAAIAALLGGLLQLSPQPATDLLLRRDLAPAATRPVLLVAVDPGASPGAWVRLAAQLTEGGAAAVALIDAATTTPTGPEVVRLSRPGEAFGEAGFEADWDRRYRTWDPAPGGSPSLPARLIAASGQPVPQGVQRLAIAPGGVPTLSQGQVAGLSSAALRGRIAVVGSLDAWSSPRLDTPGASMPLAEAVARAAAGPNLPVLSPLASGAIAGLLAFGATSTLLLLRTQVARLGFLATCALVGTALSALALRLGLVLPVETFLAGLFAAGFTWRAASSQNVEIQVQRLQDNLLVRLGEGLGLAEPSLETTWRDLCRAAVSWGGAEAAWAYQRQVQGFTPRGRAGQVEGTDPETLAALLARQTHAGMVEPCELRRDDLVSGAGLWAVPLRAPGASPGVLVVRTRGSAAPAGGDPGQAAAPLVHPNLQVFADHAATRILRGRARAAAVAVVTEQGLRARMHELGISIEHLLDQRDLLLSSHLDSRTAHALYDPLGRPLLVDEGFRRIMEGLRGAPDADLPAVWEALSLPPATLAQVFTARAPTRETLALPGIGADCWIHACTYQNRILGVGLELVDISELLAQDTVKSGLLEMISYRVHNILAAIRGYADLLALGAVDAGEVAPRIAARCGEMAEIFDRYEGVARSVEGRTAEPIQIIDLLQEVVAGARRTLGEHRVRLVNTPVALAPALAQRTDLARALMSLIQELARDAVNRQAVLVELQAPAGTVEIVVRTEGHAAPVSVLQRLASDARGQGSALARRLVEGMGGTFVVEQGGEAGARYRIQLREA